MPASPRRPGPPSHRGPRRLPRWLNRRVLSALAVLSLALGGGWLVLRDAGLVAVQDVEVTGATGRQAGAIRAALVTAGRDMTTLHVERDPLRDAVSEFPIVKDVVTSTKPPHTLRVRVVQQVPVATLVSEATSIPVAGDGTVLRGVSPDGLPTVAQKLPPAGDRVKDKATDKLLGLLAGAPAPLRRKASRAYLGRRGLTVRLTDGPLVHFGSASRLRAKWASLVAVLASPESRGATAIDVRVPEHPAAGGLEQASTQLGEPSTGN